MKRNVMLALILGLMVAMPICMTSVSDDSDAFSVDDLNGVSIHSFDEDLKINAGNTYTLRFTIFNNDTAVTKYVSISDVKFSNNEIGKISYASNTITLDPEGYDTIEFIIDVEKYADAGDHTLGFTFTVCNSNDTSVVSTGSYSMPLEITSEYDAGDVYNKFMGLIPNTLPSPFDEPIFTALVSLIVWFFLGAVIGHLIYKLVERKWSKNNDSARKDAKSIGKQVMFIIILIGFSLCLRIYGATEVLTGMVTDIITAAFIVLIAYAAWRIYKIALYNILVKYDKDDKLDDSLMPLFKMVGRIVVCVIALSMVLKIFGLSLGTIVTSAGLVSLAISLGAQETLNQFFCGIQLMATRPFRIGDKVKLGTSTDVLIVRKIRIMDTEFKNWLNEEVFRIPNSTVMSSMITNITFRDKTYKIYEYIDVDYEADIEKAKEIMLEVVNSHPQVITDGSKDKPSFRFASMDASSIKLRASYVLTDHELSYTVPCQIKEAIFKKFRAAGIKVPHNILDVHLEE